MPLIQFDGPPLDEDQKRELVKVFTEASSRVTGIPEKNFGVLFRGYEMENVGLGGELLSDIVARKSKKPDSD